jgi:hypothetical protein
LSGGKVVVGGVEKLRMGGWILNLYSSEIDYTPVWLYGVGGSGRLNGSC